MRGWMCRAMDAKLFTSLSDIWINRPGGRDESAWLIMADVLRKAGLSSEDEKVVIDLVLNLTPSGQKNLPSYRAKIVALVHPVNPAVFDQARFEGVETNDLIAIARGRKTFRNGKVHLISKSAAGGWNEKPASEKITKAIETVFATAKTAGLPLHQVKLIFNERLRDAERTKR